MKQNDWTDQLRDRLTNHQEAVPDDLWEAIDARLKPASKTVWPWYRWAAAAAVVLLLIGGALVLWNNSNNEMLEPMADNVELLHMDSTARGTVLETTPQTAVAVVDEPMIIETSSMVTKAMPTEQSPASNEPFTVSNEPFPVSSEPSTNSSEPFPESSEPSLEHRKPQPDYYEAAPTLPTVPGRSPAKHRRLMASLYTENGLDDYNHTNPVQMSNDLAQRFASLSANHMDGASSRMQSPIWLTGYEEQERHNRPLSFGLKLSYPLGNRLSVTSGLVYTRQQSEFTTLMKGHQIDRQQTLHYVGVPLSVEYRLMQWGGLSVYASASTQIDWNVKARLAVSHVETDGEKDRCQWSLSGSLGLTYKITPHVGLYAETGVRHYLDNGSRVQNYFKAHPTSLGLQAGIRMTLGKKLE